MNLRYCLGLVWGHVFALLLDDLICRFAYNIYIFYLGQGAIPDNFSDAVYTRLIWLLRFVCLALTSTLCYMARIWAGIQLQQYFDTAEGRSRLVTMNLWIDRCTQHFFRWNALLLAVIALCTVVYICYHEAAKYWRTRKNRFPFMKLPPELRAEVFKHLVEPPTQLPHDHIDWEMTFEAWRLFLCGTLHAIVRFFSNNPRGLNRIATTRAFRAIRRWSDFDSNNLEKRTAIHALRQRRRQHPTYKHLNAIRLTNRQFEAEFINVYCRHVSPAPVFTVQASRPSLEEPAISVFGPWEKRLHLLRSCSIRLTAKPDLVPVFDPNQAKAEDWTLRSDLLASLAQMTSLKSLTLIIEATGNVHWNPIWLWFFVSQALKTSEVKGFNKIQFMMSEMKVEQDNVMARSNDGNGWEWRCEKGHFMSKDEPNVAVRRFCGKLSAQCGTCFPDIQDE